MESMKMIRSRQAMKDRLFSQSFDLIIIGGGATGGGIALDAATRGLRAALLEAEDFSSGTSSRSSKLVHGGVRYLEQAILEMDRAHYTLVKEALKERGTFLKVAPHLAHPLAILTPIYGTLEGFYYRLGLKIYDWIAAGSTLPKSRLLTKEEALERFPQLEPKKLKGAILYYDGQFNDSRMNISLILTAAARGSSVLNYARVTKFVKRERRITGVHFEDRLTGESHSIEGKVVINAAGPFLDKIRQLDDLSAPPLLSVSSGTHLLIDRKFSPSATGLLIPKTDDGRVLFLLPWEGKTLAGTTEKDCEVSAAPRPSEEDLEYILKHIARYYRDPPQREDILASWTGLRPLVKESGNRKTAQLSRSHTIEWSSQGLLSVGGGKWTTYRRMAEDAVDQAISVGRLSPKGGSLTSTTLLVGAEGYSEALAERLSKEYALSLAIARHLAGTYGDQAGKVLDLGGADGRKPLAAGYPYIQAEVVYGILEEYAVTAIDILARRTRLAFLDHAAATEALPQVVATIAPLLHWDEARQAEEKAAASRYLETMNVCIPGEMDGLHTSIRKESP